MNSIVLLFVLLKSLIHYPQLVGDSWDEATRFRMEVRAKQLEWERIQQELEAEQLTPKQVQLLQLLAVAVLLVLVLILWLMGCKRSLRREGHEEENNGANEEEARNGDANEDAGVGNAEEDDANQEEDGNDDGNGQEDGHVAANGEDNIENVNEAANAENNDLALAVYEAGTVFDDNIGRVLMERIQWPVQELQAGCEWTQNLMDNYALYFGHILSNSFYPGLQRAIGVGSAFEGWSPREQDVVYKVLIPMTPPRGHSFHLELDSAEERHEELRSNQDPSLLDTLCTDSYLDVQKTARWFYQLVTNGRESFRIEMLFGVRRGDSDIFVSSQPREAHTQSTAWPETYAVAEAKFFKHIAKQAPRDSLHLKCLQFFTRLLLGFTFSTYAMKTIVMHMLNVGPVSQWRRRHFLNRLLDISRCLRVSVLVKRVNHFIVGNQRLPHYIHLPPDIQAAPPYNLFHQLAEEPAAHTQATYECRILLKRFKRILLGEQ
ncbi:inositol 1,4,5-trisphosphate receptor-interacting protein-like 1 [Catharus ustulatus]|uniref:inositol 1,4,5-trisphosphate receptor-interacting protein-like 1 n=1 Tax=Catharus ustulatus TaxID=91951 RepID=UPI00140CB289|nr:inositol 1,4,5-trisphosphate receptor-interacting protein-like 1 [Catharus ustulatus]